MKNYIKYLLVVVIVAAITTIIWIFGVPAIQKSISKVSNSETGAESSENETNIELTSEELKEIEDFINKEENNGFAWGYSNVEAIVMAKWGKSSSAQYEEGHWEITEDESKAIISSYGEIDGDVTKVTAKEAQEIYKEKTGKEISLDNLKSNEWTYIEKYDSFYYMTGGSPYNIESKCESGYKNSSGKYIVKVSGSHEAEKWNYHTTITLQKNESTYFIIESTGVDMDSDDKENIDKSNSNNTTSNSGDSSNNKVIGISESHIANSDQTEFMKVVGLDSKNNEVWSYKTNSMEYAETNGYFRILDNNTDKVYVNNGYELVILDKQTGKILSNTKIELPINAYKFTSDNMLYALSFSYTGDQMKLYIIDANGNIKKNVDVELMDNGTIETTTIKIKEVYSDNVVIEFQDTSSNTNTKTISIK